MKFRCIDAYAGLIKKRGLHKLKIIAVFIAIISVSWVMDARSATYGNKIFALYKSSDGYSDGNNPIKWYFEPEIHRMGFSVEYHDLDSGIPDQDILDKVRAVITWYNSSVIPKKEKAREYIKFLDSAANRGVKIVIVNSFGAYGYKEDGVDRWDLINDINTVFFKMGFFFRGFWTGDPSRLKIVHVNSEMAEAGAKQDVNASRHYQMIVPIRNDVETYLTLKRTDEVKGLGDGESSAILTSKNGGFALEQYVLRNNKLMLNPSLFLKKSLFHDNGVLEAGVIIGDIENREEAERNVRYALDYAKIRHFFIDPADLKNMAAEDLMPYEVLILAVKSAEEVPFPVLKKYAEMGGRIIFARFADLTKEYMALLGLKYYSRNTKFFKEGFIISPSFSMNNFPMSGKDVDLRLREVSLFDARVLATANDMEQKGRYPLLWERTIGKGKILYWNTDLIIRSKRFRGILVQSMHDLCDFFVSGLVNAGMLMIDDFPAPLWNTYYKDYRRKYYSELLDKESDADKKNKIKQILERLKNYPDVSDTDFIRNVWIKDILAFQDRIGFRYSTFLIFNYNKDTGYKKTNDEFSVRDFYLAEGDLPVKLGFVALNNGWDLGLHGYNHQSMTVTRPKEYESEPWPNRETMVKALTVTKREWEKLYSGYTLPFVYVAPHNIIDHNGLSALGEVFPSIHVVATVYIGKQGESEQEFEYTPDRRFFQIPRLTSGYYMNDPEKFILYDAIHNFGVVSHFIHPDDVFDEIRSNGFSGWEWMKNQFVNEFSNVNRYFPWLRWMTVKDAFQEFLFYQNTNIRIKSDGNRIIVESSDGSDKFLYFRLSLKKGQKVVKTVNCTQVFANTVSGDYVFKTNNPRSEIVIR